MYIGVHPCITQGIWMCTHRTSTVVVSCWTLLTFINPTSSSTPSHLPKVFMLIVSFYIGFVCLLTNPS